jgi:urease accessory protein
VNAPQLAVSLAKDRTGRTYLASQRATHPYHLCRPLYRPEDPPGLSTLYVQGCAGGVFEHDRLTAIVRVAAGAAAHVTTAAATIVHRMPNAGHAEQNMRLEVAADALLEHFPDPLILFPGSRLTNRLDIQVGAGARVIAIESVLAHRLPDDETPFDWFDNQLRIENECGQLIARERWRATGESWRARRVGVTGSFDCQASVLVLGASSAALAPLRAALRDTPDIRAGASNLPGGAGVFARILATDGVALRASLQQAWSAARAALGLQPGRARPK